jgi:hypothetical protein
MFGVLLSDELWRTAQMPHPSKEMLVPMVHTFCAPGLRSC